MKVRQLMADLAKLDPDLDIFCFTEDSDVLPPSHGIRLFDIEATDAVEAQEMRGDDQIPSLKLGRGPHSHTHALIRITSDF